MSYLGIDLEKEKRWAKEKEEHYRKHREREMLKAVAWCSEFKPGTSRRSARMKKIEERYGKRFREDLRKRLLETGA